MSRILIGFIAKLFNQERHTRLSGVPLVMIALFTFPGVGVAQQFFTFTIEGKSYTVSSSWTVKHNAVTFKNQTEHSLDWGKSRSLDLAVHFTFRQDSLPGGSNIVWGFQYIQNGGRLSPGSNEKRARSLNQFQRFEIAATGPASLAIIPKVWKRTSQNQFESIGQGNPVTLNFNFFDSTIPAKPVGPTAAVPEADTGRPQPTGRPVQPVTPLEQLPDEETAYQTARSLGDTLQKVKALIDFVDKYSAVKPKSVLVAKAIKDVPLGISVPDDKGDGTYSLTLHHAVNPVIDSSQVRGWRYNLAPTAFGKFKLTLYDLKDSVHSIKIADLGKNAPFNRPKEIQPFEKILVRFLGESRDSFRVEVAGGTPPFILFLSKNGIAKERYIVNTTNTVKAFAKAVCESCGDGKHTLEVYNSDFSTLLLRKEDAIHIYKPNYLLYALYAAFAFAIVYFGFGKVRRWWQIFLYERRLRQINEWETKANQEKENPKDQ